MGNLGELDERYRGTFDVAIIGSSCRFPGANSLDEFWRLMINGEDYLRSPPEDRFYMNLKEGRIFPRGYLTCPIDEFDTGFFNFNRRQAEFMDPQLRLFLELAWESLEDARIPPSSLWGTDAGVFVGNCSNDYRELTRHAITDSTRMYSYMGTEWSAYPGFLSFFLGLRGPNLSTETACASSASALFEAVGSLRSRKCRVAIVGGTNLLLRNQMNLPDSIFGEACKAFDASGTGFAAAEGVAVIVVKLLEHAQEDGDRIHGVVKGVATNNCGFTNSFGTPSAEQQVRVMRDALSDAGVETQDVSFMLAHGTGTLTGDPIEAAGIVDIFGNSCATRPAPLIISSPKTNFGHTLASSGIQALLQTLLCFKHNKIPPIIHFKTMNPKIDFESIPGIIPTEPVDWLPNSNGMPRVSLFNNFGLTGTNVAVVLAEPPPTHFSSNLIEESDFQYSAPLHFLPISAKSSKSLNALCEKLKEQLEVESFELAQLAYSLQTTRTHHSMRIAILAKDRADAISKLDQGKFESQGDVRLGPGKTRDADPIAFLFTGQGSDYFEMVKGLHNSSRIFRDIFQPIAAKFKGAMGKSISELIWEDEETFDELKPQLRQPLVFCLQYALAKFWTEALGIHPSVVLGHSFGEPCAAVMAGIISFDDSLKMIRARAELLETIDAGGMMAVGVDKDVLVPLIEKFNSRDAQVLRFVDLAAINSKEQCVVSGPRESLTDFKAFVQGSEPAIKLKMLKSTHAFHSRLLDKILDQFKTALDSALFATPNCTYVSSCTGQVVREFNSEYWVQQMRQPVQFEKALQTVMALKNPPKIFIEIGTQPTLLTFVSHLGIEKVTLCPSLRAADPQCLPTLLRSLAKIYTAWNGDIQWGGLHGWRRPKVIDLPTYPFNRRVYNIMAASSMTGGAGSELVHPFLGWAFTSASSSFPAFKNILNPAHPQVSYIRDHVMCGRLILPGACFAEMLLSIQKYLQVEHLTVQDVVLHRPFEFEGGKPMEIEVTVRNGDGTNRQEVTLWVKNSADNLIKYFSGVLVGGSEKSSTKTLNMSFLAQEGIPVQLYPALRKTGMEYGEIFKSLTTIWDLGEDWYAVRVRAPEDADVLHPVVIDAMIQIVMLDLETGGYKGKEVMTLPAKIKNLQVYRNQSEASFPLYIKVHKSSQDVTELYDSEGILIGLAEVVPVLISRVDFENDLIANSLSMPDFYRENWIPVPISNGEVVREKAQNGIPAPFWLIFNSAELDADIALALREKVSEAFDARVILLSPGREFQLKPSEVTLDLLNLVHLELLAKEFPDVEGVISLWGLGVSGFGSMDKGATRSLIGGFLNILKFVGTLAEVKKFLAVTQGSIYGVEGPLASNFLPTIIQGSLKTFVTENPHIAVTGVDLDPRGESEPAKAAAYIYDQLQLMGIEREVVIRDGQASCARLLPFKSTFPPTEFEIPREPFGLSTVGISKKGYAPVLLSPFDPTTTLVKVHSVSLNYKDVAAHRSLLEKGLVPGTDFAGTIETVAPGSAFAVGDRVCGVYMPHLPIESHVTSENIGFLYRIPHWMNFNEGSTIPIALATAYLAIIKVGKLRQGERVLIHTASGGFGLTAIQLAKRVGAEIFATAGTEKKRAYLRTVIGLAHVYNSRDTNFEEEILKDTNMAGVDLVINTVTSAGFKEASLSVVVKNKGGRFIEMSKINTWGKEEVLRIRPDVTYTLYDLVEDNYADTTQIEDLIMGGHIRGTPYKVTSIDHIAKTLNKFSESKHIGKFVLQMTASNHLQLFYPQNSYLVTGGLGGIGIVVTRWLLAQGAGKVILTSRQAPTDPAIIKQVKEFGNAVTVILSDVGEPEGVRGLFQKIKAEHGPLKGIFHSAGLLRDGVISGLGFEAFEEAFQSKVNGTWNLHNESLTLDLDHFVLFSSIASNVGFAGQAPYTAANNFLDTFVKYRVHSLGLAATGINWGGWSDVGIAVNNLSPEKMFQMTERSGIHWFTAAEGIRALERTLRLGLEQVTVIKFDEQRMGVTAYPRLHAYFSVIRGQTKQGRTERGQGEKKEVTKVEERNILSELAGKVKSAMVVDRLPLLEALIEKCFRLYTSFPEGEEFDREQSLALFGMDSLIELEITNRLSKELGILIPRGKLQELETITAVAKNLLISM